MGFVRKTPNGGHRACWRDPSGKQKSKTFRTKREAAAYLAEVEGAMNHGAYIDPNAGKVRFADVADRWLAGRAVEARTAERTISLLRTHVLPQWGRWPVAEIDHLALQEWITKLGRTLAPATVGKCLGVVFAVLRAAVRSRLIAHNPAEGVTVAGSRKRRSKPVTITREAFFGKLLPATPREYRALVCAAAGAGLRWGECAGLPWGAVDLARGRLRVVQVAVETPSATVIRAYPKTRAGVRTVPMPPFLVDRLRELRAPLDDEPDPADLVFVTEIGTPLRRSNFRRRIWLPSLVRAGLLGRVTQVTDRDFRAAWRDAGGVERSVDFKTEREAVDHVATNANGGLRFHDLRHSYATWLITQGVPVNIVQTVMGHEKPSTTLDMYTHTEDDYGDRVLAAFGDPAASPLPDGQHEQKHDPDEDDETAA